MSKINTRIDNIDKPEYKEDICAKTKSTNEPTTAPRVRDINKQDEFCVQHTKEILQLELAEVISKGDL